MWIACVVRMFKTNIKRLCSSPCLSVMKLVDHRIVIVIGDMLLYVHINSSILVN